ncbi:metal-dependent protein hydrolase [Melampsora americana]|nr:metal-dependent protein hydrolase [Melampsora americana]
MSEPKKARVDGPLIGTHSGTFHADEALAVNLLRSLEEYKSSRLVRTRDPKVLETCDIVVDVGGEYKPDQNRYDHHQRGFDETYSDSHRTKLSSAGLVYKHFGKQIIATHLKLKSDDESLPILIAKMYSDFVEAIDGIDNGVTQYEAIDADGKVAQVEVRAKYRSSTSLSDRISRLNPDWNEPSSSDILDAKFEVASKLAGSEFFERLDYYAKSWLPGRELVVKALEDRFTNDVQDPQGRVLIFEQFCPWKGHLHTLEATLESSSSGEKVLPLYVLYADESGGWRVQAIPKVPDGFESRKPLPEAWRGIRDEALSQLTGIPDCVFVHAAGFIGGNKTRQGAVEMVKKALAL